jgi:hypothetical protein
MFQRLGVVPSSDVGRNVSSNSWPRHRKERQRQDRPRPTSGSSRIRRMREIRVSRNQKPTLQLPTLRKVVRGASMCEPYRLISRWANEEKRSAAPCTTAGNERYAAAESSALFLLFTRREAVGGRWIRAVLPSFLLSSSSTARRPVGRAPAQAATSPGRQGWKAPALRPLHTTQQPRRNGRT